MTGHRTAHELRIVLLSKWYHKCSQQAKRRKQGKCKSTISCAHEVLSVCICNINIPVCHTHNYEHHSGLMLETWFKVIKVPLTHCHFLSHFYFTKCRQDTLAVPWIVTMVPSQDCNSAAVWWLVLLASFAVLPATMVLNLASRRVRRHKAVSHPLVNQGGVRRNHTQQQGDAAAQDGEHT